MLRKRVSNTAQVRRCKALVRKRFRLGAEDLREIDDSVAGNCKRKLCLARAGVINADLKQRAGVENRGQRSTPRLIIVLGPKIRKNGIGEVALHQLRGPQFPVFQQFAQGILAAFVAVAAQEFAGGRGSARAGIQQRKIHLALWKRTVDERQGPKYKPQETGTLSRRVDDERPR